MAKYKLKNNRKKFDLGGGMSTPEGTFDSNGKKVAGPNGQPLKGGMSAAQGLNYAQLGVSAFQAANASQNLDPNMTEDQKVRTQADQYSQVGDQVVGQIPGFGQYYQFAKAGSDFANSQLATNTDENGDKYYKPGINAAASTWSKPTHTDQIEKMTTAANDPTGKNVGLAALSLLPGASQTVDSVRAFDKGEKFYAKYGGEVKYKNNKGVPDLSGGGYDSKNIYGNERFRTAKSTISGGMLGATVGAGAITGIAKASTGMPLGVKDDTGNSYYLQGAGIAGAIGGAYGAVSNFNSSKEDIEWEKRDLQRDQINMQDLNKYNQKSINNQEQDPLIAKYGGKIRSFNEGGLTELKGGFTHNDPSAENIHSGIPLGNTGNVAERNEGITYLDNKAVVHSNSIVLTKNANKFLKENNKGLPKQYEGMTMSDIVSKDNKRYDETLRPNDDKFYKASKAQEQKNGTGAIAIQNASEFMGSILNPDAQMAKYGGYINKFGLGGKSDGGTYYTDANQEIIDINAQYGNPPQEERDYSNLIGAGLNSLGDVYNVGRGLKGGDPVNYERVNPNTVDYTSSKNEALRNNNQTYRDMSNTLKNVNSSSMYQNLKFQSAGQKYKADSDIVNQFDTKQKNENAGIINQSRYANAATQRAEADARQMEKDIASNQVQAGLAGIGQSAALATSDNKNETAATNAISSKFPDWKLDKKTGMYKFKGQSMTAQQLLNQ